MNNLSKVTVSALAKVGTSSSDFSLPTLDAFADLIRRYSSSRLLPITTRSWMQDFQSALRLNRFRMLRLAASSRLLAVLRAWHKTSASIL